MDTFNQYYASLREKNRQENQRRWDMCLRLSPEFAAIRQEKGRAFTLSGQQGVKALHTLRQRQKDLLAQYNLPENYLEPVYTCPLCQDTGYTKEALQKKCACRLKLEQQSRMESGRINDRETFEHFNPDFYPDEVSKARGLKIKAACEQYADSLPCPAKPQLYLCGMPGLGKSFFANAIAYRGLQNGVESLRVTTYYFVQEIMNGLNTKTSPLPQYMNVPLLVLDDLGSEPMVPNITGESLFALCDERRSAGRATIYVTNLSLSELRDRYGERVTSRIADSAVTSAIQFKGSNLRERKS